MGSLLKAGLQGDRAFIKSGGGRSTGRLGAICGIIYNCIADRRNADAQGMAVKTAFMADHKGGIGDRTAVFDIIL